MLRKGAVAPSLINYYAIVQPKCEISCQLPLVNSKNAVSPTSLKAIVEPLAKLDGVTVPTPPSVFITRNLICPSTPSANVNALVPVVTISVIADTTSIAPAPESACVNPKTGVALICTLSAEASTSKAVE